jgi:osmoprotectant transport system permease protein
MNYLVEEFPRVAQLFGDHMRLTLISLGIALLIALPMGVLLSRIRWLQAPALGVLGVLYTIPSLSLLILLIPFTGLSATTAIITLVAYAQLVLVRNTLVGLNGIDPSVIEVARGMGMNNWQRFWWVEFPLALPLVIAGIRLATLSVIGIGTVAAFISAGGLGVLLFEGVRTANPQKIVAGAIAVAVLAAGLNFALRVLERRSALAIRGEEA